LTFTVELSEEAEADLKAISDARIRAEVSRGLLRLEVEPAKRGKALVGDLKSYHRIKLARQRYRAIYSIAVKAGIVKVVVVGIRRAGSKSDVYEVARKRLGGKK
jgi:mRNA-degrading endonuclease RelE of RelBE toxin-antitoxin system